MGGMTFHLKMTETDNGKLKAILLLLAYYGGGRQSKCDTKQGQQLWKSLSVASQISIKRGREGSEKKRKKMKKRGM